MQDVVEMHTSQIGRAEGISENSLTPASMDQRDAWRGRGKFLGYL